MMNTFEENLCKYLEIESILNEFFHELNYCMIQCIQQQQKADRRSVIVGCCKDKYYKNHDIEHPSFELLRKKREQRYGTPESIVNSEKTGPCEYHTSEGCRLKTHKSPICLSFLCRDAIDFLREQYQLFEYDYLGIYYALEWILTGDMSGESFEAFKNDCLNMVEKVRINSKSVYIARSI